MHQADYIIKAERSNRMLINEQLIYGRQEKKYPVRKKAVDDRINNEIQKQKMETLSISEYEKLKLDCEAKGERYLPMFIASKGSVKRVKALRNYQRLYLGLNVYFAGICMTNVPIKIGLVSQVYGVTGIVTMLNLYLYFLNRRAC